MMIVAGCTLIFLVFWLLCAVVSDWDWWGSFLWALGWVAGLGALILGLVLIAAGSA